MENDIAAYLDALRRDECYRVVRVLKEAPHETTEVVRFAGANDADLGPFVRKRIKCEACMGGAYRSLMEAQRAGARFLHLPRIEDCYERDDELVVIMEFVRGETLHEAVYRRDPSPDLAREVFPLLCDAVAELHEGFDPPIIHRDLKPGNVILSEGNLTLIDFGIARAYREGAESDTVSFGTRAYAPPEQFGFGQTDVRSDVYALGMLLYYLLTEEVPAPRLAGGPFAAPGIPAPLRSVLSRATAFDPAARYPSARALRTAFEDAFALVDVQAARQEGAAPKATGPMTPWVAGEDGAPQAPSAGGAAAVAPAGSAGVAGSPGGAAGGSAAGGAATSAIGAAAVDRAPGVLAEAPSPAVAPAAPAAAGEVSRRPSRWREGVAAVRTVAALALMALFLVSGIVEALDPRAGSSMAQYAPGIRWIGVIAVELIFVAPLYPLVDRRWLGRRLGRVLPRPGRTAAALVVIGFGLFAFMMALNGGPSS